MTDKTTIRPLPDGGTIGIVAPSGAIDADLVSAACAAIESHGYRTEVFPHVVGCATSVFAAPDDDRAADLRQALERPDIDAIICARGGYGAVRTLQKIGLEAFGRCRKWLVGFSDITVFHAALSRFGVPSVHGPMLKHIALRGMDDADVRGVFGIMRGGGFELRCRPMAGSRSGSAEGVVVGGNLSLIASLRGTPVDIDTRGKILFIEDLSEYNYHIDRMIQNLKYSGALEGLAALVVGQFTEMRDGARPFGLDAYGIVAEAVAEYDYPMLMGYPAGHADDRNAPLVMGRRARISIAPDEAVVDFSPDL